MKIKTAIAGLIVMTMVGCGQDQSAHAADKESLPKLNTVQSFTFEKPYSCGGSYEKSALFISSHARQSNAPDLLYNCSNGPSVGATPAGDDFSLISDLGEVSLESVTPRRAFNLDLISGRDNTFKENMPVQVGHSYSVLISKSDIRALYVFQVESIQADGTMKIRYAVKSYSIVQSAQIAPGFDWESRNR